MIIVETVGGLANRIRSSISGLILAEELGEPVVVSWVPHPTSCAAAHRQIYAGSAPSLFVDDAPTEEGEVWRTSKRGGLKDIFGRRVPHDAYRSPVEIPAEALTARAPTVRMRTSLMLKSPTISQERFSTRFSELLNQHFRPIVAETTQLPVATYGLHVRRGDKSRMRRQRALGGASKPSRARRAARRLLRENDETSILLCSDDDSVRRGFKNEFGERVHLMEGGDLSRSSVDGVRFAALEMYALGQVGTIVGDGNSTFGPTAARYLQAPYVNLCSDLEMRTRRLLYNASKSLKELVSWT